MALTELAVLADKIMDSLTNYQFPGFASAPPQVAAVAGNPNQDLIDQMSRMMKTMMLRQKYEFRQEIAAVTRKIDDQQHHSRYRGRSFSRGRSQS